MTTTQKTNTKVEWIILVTDKYLESKNFYQNILGFPIERDMPEEEFTQFKLMNCFLAIYGRKQISKLLGKEIIEKPGGAIYTFAETDNIDKQYQELKDKGVNFIVEPKTQPWGQRTAYFTDPDGHIWEIQQWTDKK